MYRNSILLFPLTYCVTKITCSPMIRRFFDTKIVASTEKEWLSRAHQNLRITLTLTLSLGKA